MVNVLTSLCIRFLFSKIIISTLKCCSIHFFKKISQYIEYNDYLININCYRKKTKARIKTWYFIVSGVPSRVNKGLRVKPLMKNIVPWNIGNIALDRSGYRYISLCFHIEKSLGLDVFICPSSHTLHPFLHPSLHPQRLAWVVSICGLSAPLDSRWVWLEPVGCFSQLKVTAPVKRFFPPSPLCLHFWGTPLPSLPGLEMLTAAPCDRPSFGGFPTAWPHFCKSSLCKFSLIYPTECVFCFPPECQQI